MSSAPGWHTPRLAGALLLTFLLAVPALAAAEPKALPIRFLLEWGKKGTAPGDFHFPIGVAIAADDSVFVTDHYNSRVQKFDADGKLLAHFAVLPSPGGIAIDKETLFVSHFPASRLSKEATPDRVTVWSPAGKYLREWGKSGSGDGELSWPGGIAIAKDNRIYVADQTNRRVQVFDATGKFLFKWGSYGTGPGEFGGNSVKASRVGGPQFIALDRAGNVYTTEGSVGRVQKFAADGKYLLSWGDNEDKPGSFGGKFGGFKANIVGPIGICFDKQDRVWISAVSGRVQQFTSDGKYLCGFGAEQGTLPGQFLAPHGVAINSRGQLYVVDAYNHRVQKFEVPR